MVRTKIKPEVAEVEMKKILKRLRIFTFSLDGKDSL